MTQEQEFLLLTVARILRANLNDQRNGVKAWLSEDIINLDEALKPFSTNAVSLLPGYRS